MASCILCYHTILRLDFHPGLKLRHTSAHIGFAVYDHDTIRTSADGTKYSSGLMKTRCIAMYHYPGRLKCDRNRFSLISLDRGSVEVESDKLALIKCLQNRVFCNSHCGISNPVVSVCFLCK